MSSASTGAGAASAVTVGVGVGVAVTVSVGVGVGVSVTVSVGTGSGSGVAVTVSVGPATVSVGWGASVVGSGASVVGSGASVVGESDGRGDRVTSGRDAVTDGSALPSTEPVTVGRVMPSPEQPASTVTASTAAVMGPHADRLLEVLLLPTSLPSCRADRLPVTRVWFHRPPRGITPRG